MSKLPYMKLWIGDLLTDTDDLGPSEFGIYMRLIVHAWKHEGRIPTDDRRLCNITKCDPRMWWKYKEIILKYFETVQHCSGTLDPSAMQHSRVIAELHSSRKKSNKNKASAEKMHSERRANAAADAVLSHSYSHKEEKEDALAALAPPPGAEEGAPLALPAMELAGGARAAPAIYAFERGRVRFTQEDYAQLERDFRHIDVPGALAALAKLCTDKSDWYGFILNALAKRNQVARERIELEKVRAAQLADHSDEARYARRGGMID